MKVSLAPGETLRKTSAAFLAPGDSVLFYWNLVADTVSQTTPLLFSFDLVEPKPTPAHCSTITTLPVIPHYEAALDCGPPLIVGL